MLNPTPPTEVQPQRTIRIPGTEVIPRIQPAISVGEVLRMVVRSNKEGNGQLYFRGLLIPATLPETLAPGDKIFAKVTEADNQLVLKLLQTQKGEAAEEGTPARTPGAGIQNPIAKELEMLVKGSSLPLIKGAKPLPVPLAANPNLPAPTGKGDEQLPATTGKQGDVLLKAFEQLTKSLGAEVIADPKLAQSQLMEAATGKVSGSLRETAERIRTLLGEPGSSTARLLSELRGELSQLIESSADDNHQSAKQLETLIRSLSDEMKSGKKTGSKERELLKVTLDELKSAKDHPEKGTGQLEPALRRLHDAFGAPVRSQLDPQTQSELQQIASRLEQMASSQESLNQLNPVMQALGEPALILFPFLAHGLLSHSEVSIESRLDGDARGGGRQDRDEDEAPDTTAYQRVQVSVPLPELGTVDVDIAHRKDEILVRFSVSDPEISAFLLEQLEHLGTTLRSLNFKKTELMTHVGRRTDSSVAWLEASTSTTIIA